MTSPWILESHPLQHSCQPLRGHNQDSETGDVIKAWPVDFAKIGEQVIEALPGMITGKIMGEDAIVEALVPIVKETLYSAVQTALQIQGHQVEIYAK